MDLSSRTLSPFTCSHTMPSIGTPSQPGLLCQGYSNPVRRNLPMEEKVLSKLPQNLTAHLRPVWTKLWRPAPCPSDESQECTRNAPTVSPPGKFHTFKGSFFRNRLTSKTVRFSWLTWMLKTISESAMYSLESLWTPHSRSRRWKYFVMETFWISGWKAWRPLGERKDNASNGEILCWKPTRKHD